MYDSDAEGTQPSPPASLEAGLTFEDVYASLADAVYRYCRSQLRDPDLAEEAAAEALAHACQAFPRNRPEPSWVRAWLFRIAHNAVADQARRAARRRALMGRLLMRPTPGIDVESAVDVRDDLRTTLSAMARLPERDRAIVAMRATAGLGYGEIAEILGMTEEAARVAGHRAIKRLRTAVQGHD
ncbi:MAG: sigma-70 family RNA polymerase sigma factor [Chloroflexi bacterium]|nr:MAG: sigma-70 family RNA polymerase sigma factor [Chloroflexota bacterium]